MMAPKAALRVAALAAALLLQPAAASTNLTVALVAQAPWTYVTTIPGQPPFYSGIIVDLLTAVTLQANALCANTQDLTCGINIQYQLYDAWGMQLPNGTWTDAIGDMLGGRVQVIPALPFMQMWSDLGVAFSSPWSQSTLAFVTKQVVVERGLAFFLAPFEPALWYLTFGSFAIVAVVIALMDRFRGRTYEHPETTASDDVASGSAGAEHQDARDTHKNGHGASDDAPPPIPFRDAVFRSALALVGLATVPPPSHAQRLAHLR